MDEHLQAIDLELVGESVCVKVLERLCGDLLSQSDTDPQGALLSLAKQCPPELIDQAIAAIQKDTCGAATTEAKLTHCAQFIFGEKMRTLTATTDSLNGVKESSEALLSYVFHQAGSKCKFDLGDLRKVFEMAKQFIAGKGASSSNGGVVAGDGTAMMQ